MTFGRHALTTMAGLMAALALVAAALPASACMICMPYPQKTGADLALDAATAVLARESHDRPFTFEAVEVLKGHYDGRSIPLLLDTAIQRRLESEPSLAVVLVQGRGGGWTRLGAGDSSYQAVMRDVARGVLDTMTPAERAEFFAPHLGSGDDALAELAFLEVARAPYASIRDLKTTFGRDDLYRGIGDFFRIEWHPLYILLLGTSDRPDDIAFIRGKFDAAARFGMTTNLAAYATALIEMEGAGAIRHIADTYFAGDAHTDAELIEILKALSVQGNSGRAEFRTAVIEVYGLLLDRRPALAGYAANDLFDWRVVYLGPRMREILAAGLVTDEASELAIASYLASMDGRTPARGLALSRPTTAPIE